MDSFAIVNGRVFAETGIIDKGFVIVSGDRISAIGEGNYPEGFTGKIIDVMEEEKGEHVEIEII